MDRLCVRYRPACPWGSVLTVRGQAVGSLVAVDLCVALAVGINEGEVEARYINTLLNISDPLTKAVSREVVSELAPVIAGIGDEPDMPDPEDQREG